MAEDMWGELAEETPKIDLPKVEEESVSKEVIGLLYVGYLADTFDLFGSQISIRTLKIGEELEAELLVSKYRDTQEENRAYMTALVAACITSVNNAPLIQGLGPIGESLERKFVYITTNWHWITIAAIYDHYRILVETVMNSFDEVKKK